MPTKKLSEPMKNGLHEVAKQRIRRDAVGFVSGYVQTNTLVALEARGLIHAPGRRTKLRTVKLTKAGERELALLNG